MVTKYDTWASVYARGSLEGGKQMNELHCEVLVDTPEHKLTVNVFTEKEDKEFIKKLSINETVSRLKELGFDCKAKDVKPIGYKIVRKFDY